MPCHATISIMILTLPLLVSKAQPVRSRERIGVCLRTDADLAIGCIYLSLLVCGMEWCSALTYWFNTTGAGDMDAAATAAAAGAGGGKIYLVYYRFGNKVYEGFHLHLFVSQC